jgi:uncharacterized protein
MLIKPCTVIRLILIDTNVFVAYIVAEDVNHDDSIRVMNRIAAGDFGSVFTSDYIFDETLTVTLVRSKSLKKAIQAGNYIRSSIEILKVGEEVFEDAWSMFGKRKNSELSFTDCTNIALMSYKDIRYIATFDNEFKSVSSVKVVR